MDEDRANPLELPGLDITGDGAFTLGDVEAWALYLLFLPGDAAIAALVEHVPGLARFLELGANDYGGTLSICLSIVAWLILLIVIGLVWNAIRNLDRALTAYVVGRIDELRRQLRIARRRITSWIGQMRARTSI